MSNLTKNARNASIDTPLDRLRAMERALIKANTDDADMCLPHIESLILYKVYSDRA